MVHLHGFNLNCLPSFLHRFDSFPVAQCFQESYGLWNAPVHRVPSFKSTATFQLRGLESASNIKLMHDFFAYSKCFITLLIYPSEPHSPTHPEDDSDIIQEAQGKQDWSKMMAVIAKTTAGSIKINQWTQILLIPRVLYQMSHSMI